MHVLEYQHLETHKVKKQYQKIVAMIKNDDWYSAEVKKLKPTHYYRAKLDHSNRLLFKIVTYQGEKYALMLEVIHQHAYDQSKFLKGATIEESKMLHAADDTHHDTLIYMNNQQPNFHVLDKIISFDDCQEEAYHLPSPIVIIGPAGSGKTALTLEKMKGCQGDVLYITHSAYLVHHSRELYYAHNTVSDEAQSIDFLSYPEFIETIAVPPGREITFKDFARWLTRCSPPKIARDPHKLYEEFKGVLSGTDTEQAYLTKDDYFNLGIKQSIYPQDEKVVIYSLYEKYLSFLQETGLYDVNLISHVYLDKAMPTYDFVVIDEIQDFTNIQLLLILKALKTAGQFILCGDANQIVHPNFFSWAKIKTLFYTGSIEFTHNATRILHTNYRSAQTITHLANLVLKIKNIRLGSVDKESNYLMQNNTTQPGAAFLLTASSSDVRTLNEKTKKSTQYAVIVLRDDLKAAAQRHFDTPLVFSIHEVKGLEYEHIILYDFIASESAAFFEIMRGVTVDDLKQDLTYARAKNKTDRSLEIYKFYTNALYVAITRAVTTLYWVESIPQHPLLDLLGVKALQSGWRIEGRESSLEEWQQEARKLELQGKQDQADAIRSQLIQEKPVPWEVLTTERISVLTKNVLRMGAAKKSKIQLLEYALVYDKLHLLQLLVEQGMSTAEKPKKCRDLIQRKYYDIYTSKNIKTALQQASLYGVNFRNPFNQTLLMIAAQVGNVALANALLQSGARSDLADNAGHTAFQYALRHAIEDKRYAETCWSDFYRLLAPDSVSLQIQGKLMKIDQRKIEYLMYYVAMKLSSSTASLSQGALTAQQVVDSVQHFPVDVLPAFRKKRTYLPSILSKNEVDRVGPYNRQLFKRMQRGYYWINPTLKIKINDQWQSACDDIQDTVDRTE